MAKNNQPMWDFLDGNMFWVLLIVMAICSAIVETCN